MATDFTSRPKPPVLKRFANLDIDGVEKPERSAPAPRTGKESAKMVTTAPRPATRRPSQEDAPLVIANTPTGPRADSDLRDFELLAEELNDNVRDAMNLPARSGPRPRFNMPMPGGPAAQTRAERALELARMRPPDPILPPPGPSRRGPIETQLGVNARLWDQPRAVPRRADFDELDLEGMTPGVVTVEMDLRRGRPNPRLARPERAETPLELTPMAARQVMLMSWEAGVPGSALRILTSTVGGLGRPEIDFVFDEHMEADDVVFESHGVTIVIDPESLRWVAGRRISWHDVPGSEGFGVG